MLLATKLGWHLLDSGAIYRVLAVAALKHQIALDDITSLAELAANLNVHFPIEDDQVLIVLVVHMNEDVLVSTCECFVRTVVEDFLDALEYHRSTALAKIHARPVSDIIRKRQTFDIAFVVCICCC
jgi:cytidylate kinase